MSKRTIEEVKQELLVSTKARAKAFHHHTKWRNKTNELDDGISILIKELDILKTKVIATTKGKSDDLTDLIHEMLRDGKLIYNRSSACYVKLVDDWHTIQCSGHHGKNGFNPYGGRKFAMYFVRKHEEHDYCITKHEDQDEYVIRHMDGFWKYDVDPEDY